MSVKGYLLLLLLAVPAMAFVDVGPAPDVTIERHDWSVTPVTLAQIKIEDGKFGQPKPVEIDDYAVAYHSAQACGKLCVYIGMDGCPHCPGAKKVFDECAAKSGGACIAFDRDKDAKYVDEIVREHGKGRGCPQVVVYTRSGDEWHMGVVIGNDPDKIRRAMIGSSGVGGFEAECLHFASAECKCESCPADCAAKGCHCSSSSGHGGESCGAASGWYVPGQPVRNVVRGSAQLTRKTVDWFREHKPVRRGLAAVGRAITPPRWRCR